MGNFSRLLFGIAADETGIQKRGFQVAASEVQERIEQIGRTFVEGYHAALLDSSVPRLAARLEPVEPELQGFAYEGAAMGLMLLDLVAPWQNRWKTFAEGPGEKHLYMLHVGAGWAMARVPFSTGRLLSRMDPLLRWLAFDGLGFHQGYFQWRRFVDRCATPSQPDGYARRAFDQGLGRSLWFIKGADPGAIAAAIGHFPETRHSDLWSGVGLAATYAGGVAAETLTDLRERGSDYRAALAQGAAFAAKARLRAGNPSQHTAVAVFQLCGISMEDAAAVTDKALQGLPDDGEVPAYEIWRWRIQNRFGPAMAVRNFSATRQAPSASGAWVTR